MDASASSLPFFRTTCHRCTLQACKRFGQPVNRQGLVCSHTGCPVLNRPSVFRSWWMRAFIVLLILAAGMGVARQIEAARRAARRPRLVSLSSQPTVWRGQPWEAFVKADGEGVLAYQWYSGFPGDVSLPVSDAREPTLRISDLQTQGRYWVRVSSEYGNADSEGVVVEPHIMDPDDHRAELDELIGLSRTMLEQRDNLREIDNTFHALGALDEREQRRYEDMRIRSSRRAQEAASMLIGKLDRLRGQARSSTINQILHDNRPATQPSGSFEYERQRKAFDLIETLWRTLRDGGAISDKLAIELANTKLPL